MQSKRFDKINKVLAKWNPIGVPNEIAIDEYKAFVSIINEAASNEETLLKCLEDILLNKIGLEYDKKNLEHVEDLKKVSLEILEI